MSEQKIERFRPSDSGNALFTESAVQFLTAYRVWIVAAESNIDLEMISGQSGEKREPFFMGEN